MKPRSPNSRRCFVTWKATIATGARTPDCARRWAKRAGRCTILRSHPVCSPTLSRVWRSPAVPSTRVSWSKSRSDAIRDEKTRLLKAVRPIVPADVVRGQFCGYKNEEGVAPDSQVETFAAVRLFIDSWRWADVPFYIRAGKCLPVTVNEVVVEFKR